MSQKQYTFTEMSRKTVINVADGRELGHVCDVVFNNCGGIIGFVVPGKKSFFKSITSSDNVFIPWNRIIKIGSDVILTELVGCRASTFSMQPDAPQRGTAETYAARQNVEAAEAYPRQTVNNGEPYPRDGYAQQPPNGAYEQQKYTCHQDTYVPSELEPSSAQTVYHTDNKPEY